VESVNIGVIGCGQMGMDIVRRVVGCNPQLRVVALYDPDKNSLDRAQSELTSSPVLCSSYHKIMEMSNVQWVMIASWNSYHREQTVSAFEAGKHVFCQKPLAINMDEVIQMWNVWKQSGKMFNLGFTLRYSPHYRKIKQLISNGHIGQIVSMEFNETLDFNHGGYIMGDWRRLRKHAGTHMLEKTSHDIDLANWMVETVAKRVASFGDLNFFKPENSYLVKQLSTNKDGKAAYSAMSGPNSLDPFHSDKDIVDNQVVILEYENGVRATFHTNCNAAIPERRMYILGTEGAILADVLTGKIFIKRIGFDTQIKDESTGAKGGHGDGDEVLAKELAESMLNQTPPSVGLMEGLTSAVTCFAIDEAMDNGVVVDVDNYWNKIGLSIPELINKR